jgi:hypothetical protein
MMTYRMERWLIVEIYVGRSLCQVVEFIEQYVLKPFFQVFLGDKSSRWRKLNNGLPQGSHCSACTCPISHQHYRTSSNILMTLH